MPLKEKNLLLLKRVRNVNAVSKNDFKETSFKQKQSRSNKLHIMARKKLTINRHKIIIPQRWLPHALSIRANRSL